MNNQTSNNNNNNQNNLSHDRQNIQFRTNNQGINSQNQNAINSHSVSRLNHNTSALSIMGNGSVLDPRRNDLKYACLQVKKAEFFCTKENLVLHSNYLRRVFEKQEFSHDAKERISQIKIRLPESTKIDVLIMFLDFIDKGKELPNKIDLYIAQNILLIGEALKMRQIQRRFLMEILMPMLNRENVIFFLKMSYNKLSAGKNQDEQQLLQDDLESQTSHQEEEEFWFDFFTYALDLAAQYLQFLIKRKNDELHNVLEPQIVEEMIDRAIKFYRADLYFDNSLIFDTLMKLRKCDSIFQLLEQERLKIIETEEALIANSQETIRPTLTWRIQKLSGNFYRESDPFMVEQAQWKLSVSYFKMEEEALSVQMKMVNNPFEVKKSKDYFKKKEFFLASNVAGVSNQVNPLEEALDDENLTQEEINRRRKQIDQANSEYPSHAFITIVSCVRINSEGGMSPPQVHTLICSAKTPALLHKYNDFKIDENAENLTVEIYFKTKYIYSAILLYISRNFTYLITEPSISQLPKDQFKLLLKHKLLNVTQEDEVVKALCMWAEGQEARQSLDLDLVELLENINWNYVSLQCILDLMRNFPYIRRNPTFHKTIMKEFAMRNKFNPETTNLDAPRFSYKYNKSQNNLHLNKVAKNAKALLYINHENFFQNLIESMLEPVDLIKAHLVNEGINESSHRKHLELQLLQKKREISQIEDQLNNMKYMDELTKAAVNNSASRRNSKAKGHQRPLSQANNRNGGGHNTSVGYVGKGMLNNNSELGAGDEIETVKNSMINLLNVVVEADDNPNDNTSQNHHRNNNDPSARHNLRELSQEAVQKMKNQPQQNNNELNFQDMYDELNSIAQGNKIQILFKSQTDQNLQQNTGNIINSGQGNTGMNEQEEEEDDADQRSPSLQLNAAVEEEMKSFTEARQSGLNHAQKRNSLLKNNHLSERSESIVIVNEPGGPEIRKKQLQSFTSQSSKIIVGGGTLISPIQRQQVIQNYQAQNQSLHRQKSSHGQQAYVMVNESKGIQTSMQRMQSISVQSKKDPPVEVQIGTSQVYIAPMREYVDQSIQMTFEEPPEDLIKDDIMLNHEEEDDEDQHEDELIDNRKELERFLSHQASSLSAVSDRGGDNSNHKIMQKTLTRSLHEEGAALVQGLGEEDDPTKECTQQIPFLSPIQVPISNVSQHQNTVESVEMNKEANQQIHFEQMKIKYQKQLMQEYTSLVEKMSKDVFDHNFLKNFQFLSPQQPGTAGPSQSEQLDGTMANPNFQSPYNHNHSLSPNQVQVQNPKVHNLNISIHNNANYAAPFPLESIPSQSYTPINHFSTVASAQPQICNVQQFPSQQFMKTNGANLSQNQATMKIPLKSGVKTPTTGAITGNSTLAKQTPTGQQQKPSMVPNKSFNHLTGSNKKQKPQSAAYQSMQPSTQLGFSYQNESQSAQQSLNTSKEQQQQQQHQISGGQQRQRPQSSNIHNAVKGQMHQQQIMGQKVKGGAGATFKKPQNFVHLQIESADSTIRSQTPITHSHLQEHPSAKHNHHTYTQVSLKGQQSALNSQQLRMKGLNSPHLAQYVNTTMPNSVKHSQPIKMYTYQNQQQAHQKVVKASAINKNQNKVILQQILNDNGQLALMSHGGTIIGQKSGNGTYQMTIDQSGEGARGSSSMGNTHHKTKSQPNANIFQWTTGHYTGSAMEQQYTGGQANHTREKSNEHLQNEIMRLIVEDNNQPQLWNQTPQASSVPLQNQSFHARKGSLPNQALQQMVMMPQTTNSYMPNFNILDQIKHSQTPSHQMYGQGSIPNTKRAQSNCSVGSTGHPQGQYPQMTPAYHQGASGFNTEIKPQIANFGNLAMHHSKHNNYGNIVLDLAKLKNAANSTHQIPLQSVNQMMNYRNNGELCTIEESKRSEPMHDSESYYNAGPISQTLEANPGPAIIQNQQQMNSSSLSQSHNSYHTQPRFDHSRTGSSGSQKAPGSKVTAQNAVGSGSSFMQPSSVGLRKSSAQQNNYHHGSSSMSYNSQNNQALNRCQPHDLPEYD